MRDKAWATFGRWNVLTLALLAAPVSAQAEGETGRADPGLARLKREIARLAAEAGGVTGVAAVHVESGRRVSLRAGERFPMASTFNLPVAVQLLTRVDHGEVQLEQMVEVRTRDLRPGSGTLTELFNTPGLALSVRNLFELMLVVGDNTAADLVLDLAGGPEAVGARLRVLGAGGIDVSRSTVQRLADWAGVRALPPESEWSPEALVKAWEDVGREDRRAAAAAFGADPRDTATPEATLALLERLERREALMPATTELLLDVMTRCRTGEARLKGMLPAGTPVAHVSGGLGGATNDVGIVTLPDDAGHVILAVFVKSSDRDVADRDHAIAEIARAVYDFFLFSPKP